MPIAVNQWFWQKTNKMSIDLFRNIFETDKKVFWWDPNTLSTSAVGSRLPWFISWFLGAFSKKYVFRKNGPDHSQVMRGVVDWAHRVRW